MRAALVFIGAITAGSGCSGAPVQAPAGPPAPIPLRPAALDAGTGPVPDPAPVPGDAAAALGARGAACANERPCARDLACLPAPGGYCGSTCGALGTACDGACVETPRFGELCLASCATTADCRAGEGYVCDPHWRACVLPNTAAIVPRSCPGDAARDPAFGPVTALSAAASPGLYQLEPAAALTGDGGLVALYLGRRGQDDDTTLGLARLDARGAAVAPGATLDATSATPFPSPRLHNSGPRLARGGDGALHAVWRAAHARDGSGGAGAEIELATSRDRGATWSAARPVHDPGDCSDGAADCVDDPLVAAGPEPGARGRRAVYVLYAAGDGLRVRASRDGGATFGPARTALRGSRANAAVGTDGRLHVVAVAGSPRGGYGAADHDVEYTSSGDGGATFARPVRVSIRDEMLPFYFANPNVAVDDRPGRSWVYVVYTRGGRDGAWDLVVAATRDRGATWTRRRIGDDPACAIHMVPNAALDPSTGELHVAWYDSRAGGRFAHAVCAPGAASCTQRGSIQAAPFAALSTVRHAPHWLGEYQALLVDDARRTLHAVWTQPVAEPRPDGPPVATSRIFHAAAALPRATGRSSRRR